MTKVLMICLGNICRSPLAEGILQFKLPNDLFMVDSAGTGNWHVGQSPDKRSIDVAKKYGIDISKQKCRQIHTTDLDTFDMIYVMDQSNYQNVLKLCKNDAQRDKVKLILTENPNTKILEVPDPYYGEMSDFENVYQILDEVTNVIVKKLNTAN